MDMPKGAKPAIERDIPRDEALRVFAAMENNHG
jgi:hypothetical protein